MGHVDNSVVKRLGAGAIAVLFIAMSLLSVWVFGACASGKKFTQEAGIARIDGVESEDDFDDGDGFTAVIRPIIKTEVDEFDGFKTTFLVGNKLANPDGKLAPWVDFSMVSVNKDSMSMYNIVILVSMTNQAYRPEQLDLIIDGQKFLKLEGKNEISDSSQESFAVHISETITAKLAQAKTVKFRITGGRTLKRTLGPNNIANLKKFLKVAGFEPGSQDTPATIEPAWNELKRSSTETPSDTRDGSVTLPSMPTGCCKVCKGSKACGDSCISADKTCNKPVGCACN